MDSNKARRARALRIRAAILKDGRFLLHPKRSLPFDLLFRWGERTLHVEVKDFTGAGAGEPQSDYVASIVNRTGHLYRQVLAGREAEEWIQEYTEMVFRFEAECIGHNIQFWRMQADPWRRMLLNVQAMLGGGDMAAFRPRPAAGERQAVGLSLICGKEVGPGRAARILERFYVTLQPRGPDTYLDDCHGIGPGGMAAVGKAGLLPAGGLSRPRGQR